LYYLKTEMDSFSKLQAIISDKTLINEEDAITFCLSFSLMPQIPGHHNSEYTDHR
ncbi:unnamed protein product, partial [marine sediment metagenome]